MMKAENLSWFNGDWLFLLSADKYTKNVLNSQKCVSSPLNYLTLSGNHKWHMLNVDWDPISLYHPHAIQFYTKLDHKDQ